jgi:TetR/AcrR family transcriptional regulator, cholesterol catabolism regulator
MTSETYARILQTARRLFVQQGYTATSMRQIALQTGIGKATIYHHFPDKQSIVTALLEESNARMQESLRLIQEQPDPRMRIQVAATESMNFFFESADLIQVVRREVAGVREGMQAGFMSFFQQFLALLTEAIQRGIQQGSFRPSDPAQPARVLLTMLQGTFAMGYLGGLRPESPQQTVAVLLDVFFHGIDA